MRSYAPPSGSIPTLPVPSLDGISSVHMIGVGGAGMRNLARLLLSRGIEVRGSDMKDSKGVRELVAAGADVWVGHDPERLGTPDAVIISSAIGDANPELRAARERACPCGAQQALAALVAGHRAVAVAGTHGKTTTTSMIAGARAVRAGPELPDRRRPQRERERRAERRRRRLRLRGR